MELNVAEDIVKLVNEAYHSLLYTDRSQKVYHYTSAEGLLGILQTQALRATNVEFLNDPSEVVYTLEQYKEMLRERASSAGPKLFPILESVLDSSLLARSYVISFSRDSNSLNLWNHYGRSDGYSLSFDFVDIEGPKSTLAFLSEGEYKVFPYSMFAGSVQYDENLQREFLELVVDKMILVGKQILEESSQAEALSVPMPSETVWHSCLSRIWQHLLPALYMCKASHHRGENEIRVVIFPSEINTLPKVEHYTSRGGIIVPYIQVKFGRRLPVGDIVVGPRVKDEIAKSGVRKILVGCGLNWVKVTECGIKIRF